MKKLHKLIEKLILITMLVGALGSLDLGELTKPTYASNLQVKNKKHNKKVKKSKRNKNRKSKTKKKRKKLKKARSTVARKINKNQKIDNGQGHYRKIPQNQQQVPTAKVYLAIPSAEPDYALALAGMRAWNQTGCFNFVPTNNLRKAQIAITNGIWPNVTWAGLTEMPNVPNGFLYGSIIRLNDYYILLSSPEIGLDVVEHELGHAIGLNHDDTEKSVMNSTIGPDHYSSIQPCDVAKVQALYGEKKVVASAN